MKRGKFFVFEGIDGAGKSTQSAKLHALALELNIPVKKLFEPTGGIWGRKIREMLAGSTPLPVEEQIELFIKDREEDYALNIAPSISCGTSIVMDRYFYSNAAYQGSEVITPAQIIEMNLQHGFPIPDRVYFIDLAPVDAMKRIEKRNSSGQRDLFEKRSFLENVRKNFLEIADKSFLIVDGSRSDEEIFTIIKDDFLNVIERP